MSYRIRGGGLCMEEVGKHQDECCKEKYLYFGRIVEEIQYSRVPCSEIGYLGEGEEDRPFFTIY